MKENVLKTKSFDFSLRIVKLFQYMQKTKKEYVLSNQLLRAGTSVGAMVREAEYAESKSDFIHKLSIAQKEINETNYWLELLYKAGYLSAQQFDSMSIDTTVIIKIITRSIKTAKQKMIKD